MLARLSVFMTSERTEVMGAVEVYHVELFSSHMPQAFSETQLCTLHLVLNSPVSFRA